MRRINDGQRRHGRLMMRRYVPDDDSYDHLVL